MHLCLYACYVHNLSGGCGSPGTKPCRIKVSSLIVLEYLNRIFHGLYEKRRLCIWFNIKSIVKVPHTCWHRMLIQLCANKGEYVEPSPQYLAIKSIQTVITASVYTKKNYKSMYKCNVLSVSTAYMYTAYKPGMFVISVQLSGTYSKYTIRTRLIIKFTWNFLD